MNNEKFIEIRLIGSDIIPGHIRSSELADIIKSVEEMISSVVIRDVPELKKENIVIGLTHIESKSIGLQFSPNLPEQAFNAAHLITQSLNEQNFAHLPHSSLKALNVIASFTRKHHCNAELRTQNGVDTLLAVITPETEIIYASSLTGQTTLYGEVMRVGGAEPRIMLKTIDEQTVYCDISYELAKQVAEHLYTQVCVSGTAKWSPDTLDLEEFRIEDIVDYEESSAIEAFNALSQLIGSQFSAIDNVETFVTTIRRGELEG